MELFPDIINNTGTSCRPPCARSWSGCCRNETVNKTVHFSLKFFLSLGLLLPPPPPLLSAKLLQCPFSYHSPTNPFKLPQRPSSQDFSPKLHFKFPSGFHMKLAVAMSQSLSGPHQLWQCVGCFFFKCFFSLVRRVLHLLDFPPSCCLLGCSYWAALDYSSWSSTFYLYHLL